MQTSPTPHHIPPIGLLNAKRTLENTNAPAGIAHAPSFPLQCASETKQTGWHRRLLIYPWWFRGESFGAVASPGKLIHPHQNKQQSPGLNTRLANP